MRSWRLQKLISSGNMGSFVSPLAVALFILIPSYLYGQTVVQPSAPIAWGTILYTVNDVMLFTWDGKVYRPVGSARVGTGLVVVDDVREDGYIAVRTPAGWVAIVEKKALVSSAPISALIQNFQSSQGTQDRCLASILPKNGQITSRNAKGVHKITVEHRVSSTTLVKIKNRKKTVLSFFVTGIGSTTITQVPEGSFRVSFLTADQWEYYCEAADSQRKIRPKSEGTAYEFEDSDDYLTKRDGNSIVTAHWSYTLQKISGGNARTQIVPMDRFLNDE